MAMCLTEYTKCSLKAITKNGLQSLYKFITNEQNFGYFYYFQWVGEGLGRDVQAGGGNDTSKGMPYSYLL